MTPLGLQGTELFSSIWNGAIFSRKSRSNESERADKEDQEESSIASQRARRRRWIKTALEGFRPSKRATDLLAMAKELGDRLLPAFDTPTSLPFARINLRYGISEGETEETCAAAAGSLTLEFTVLSQLTGNPVYERVARKSFLNTWARRVPSTNLVGNSIGVRNGHWMLPGASGIGAGIDSFYEYALKSAVLFDDDVYMEVWEDAYRAVMQHIRASDTHLVSRTELTWSGCMADPSCSVPERAFADRTACWDATRFPVCLLAWTSGPSWRCGKRHQKPSCVLASLAKTLVSTRGLQLRQ